MNQNATRNNTNQQDCWASYLRHEQPNAQRDPYDRISKITCTVVRSLRIAVRWWVRQIRIQWAHPCQDGKVLAILLAVVGLGLVVCCAQIMVFVVPFLLLAAFLMAVAASIRQ